MYETKPWLKSYGDVPESLDYPDVTLYEALRSTADRYPDSVAWDFFGTTRTYRDFLREVDTCAGALSSLGLSAGDRITISMPTCPQAIICFYAALKLGAVCSMIHPLSPPKEIAFYLELSQSKHALTLDAFYPAFAEVIDQTPLEHLLLARIGDYMPLPVRFGFWLTRGRKIKRVPPDPRVRWWHQQMRASHPSVEAGDSDPDDLAVILYSGGTTGTPKGIMLSHRNFVSEGMMASVWAGLAHGESILAVLPVFHGFGLGICVNAAFMGGGTSILVPQFSADIMAKLIKKKQPSFIVGVPTVYEALTRHPGLQSVDLSFLKGAFCGADHLPRPVKERFEALVARQGGHLKLLEGYGLTEAVTAIMCMPLTEYREGSIGIPWPDMMAKVVKVDTTDEATVGEEGELCVSGPAVMKGYLDQPDETALTLKKHDDGLVWLHTGDLATMDEDGFFYFKQRLKRMIKSSGMNVYPSQIEGILLEHPDVEQACVIGVPDEKQVQRVKAFVVLAKGANPSPEKEREIIAHCRERVIKWSCPQTIEFRETLPLTLVGKVAYRALEEEELARRRAAGEYVGD